MTKKATGKPFEPGQSGNPSGRPRGSGTTATLRADIAKHVPEIITKLVEQAKAGDTKAARLLIERVCPALKPVEAATTVPITGESFTDQGRSALQAMAAGQLSVSQAAQLINALSGMAKLTQMDELERRLAALEQERKES